VLSWGTPGCLGAPSPSSSFLPCGKRISCETTCVSRLVCRPVIKATSVGCLCKPVNPSLRCLVTPPPAFGVVARGVRGTSRLAFSTRHARHHDMHWLCVYSMRLARWPSVRPCLATKASQLQGQGPDGGQGRRCARRA